MSTNESRGPETRYAAGYPIKLVRDDIGERLGGEGTITYELINDEAEHVALLRRKLVEEAAEYLANPSVEELADVLAVARALARVDLRTAWGHIDVAEHRKRAERGGFERGMVMVGHHPADGRDLLPAVRQEEAPTPEPQWAPGTTAFGSYTGRDDGPPPSPPCSDEPLGTCPIHGDYWTDDCTRCGR